MRADRTVREQTYVRRSRSPTRWSSETWETADLPRPQQDLRDVRRRASARSGSRSTHDEQRALTSMDPDTFFVPPYVGPSGWVGVRFRDRRPRRAARAPDRGVADDRAEAPRAGVRRGDAADVLLIRCPWCGARDEIEFRYGGQAHIAVPRGPRGAERRGVGRLPVHARQPEGRVRGAVVPRGGVPALVQRRSATRRRTRIAVDLPARRGAARVTGRAAASRTAARGSTARGRSRSRSTAGHSRLRGRHRRERAARERRRRRVPQPDRCGPPARRPRGRRRGAERVRRGLGALVRAVAPATMVDARRRHRVVASRPGRRTPAARGRADRGRAAAHRTRTSRRSSIGGGRDGCAGGGRGARTRRPRAAGRAALGRSSVEPAATPGRRRHVPARTTAAGLLRRRVRRLLRARGASRRALWHVRARARRPRDRRARAPDRVRRQRPAGRDARRRRARYLERFGVLVGARAVVFTTNDAGFARGSSSRRPARGAGDRGRRRDRRRPGRARGAERRSAGASSPGREGDRRLEAVRSRERPAVDRRTIEADLAARLERRVRPEPSRSAARSAAASAYDEARATLRPRRRGAAVAPVSARRRAARSPTGVPAVGRPRRRRRGEQFVELQRDQTVADVAARSTRGLRSAEHVKRATYIGTAIDQGRTSGVSPPRS